jgi:dihydrofolate reductase
MTRDQAGRLLSPNMFAYFKDFGFNTTHPVLKSLMKKTYQYVLLNKKKQERTNKVTKRNSDIEQQEKEFNERKEALDKQLKASYTTIIDR